MGRSRRARWDICWRSVQTTKSQIPLVTVTPSSLRGKVCVNTHRAEGVWLETTNSSIKSMGGHKGPWNAQLQRGRLYHTPSPRLRNQYDRGGGKTVRARGAEDRYKTASPGHSRTTALINTAAVAANIRPTQDQTHQHSAWSGEEL